MPSDTRIAIIGCAIRLPGADDLDSFWRLLAGRDSAIRRVGEDELHAAGVTATGADYVPFWGGPDQADGFDAGFFGYSPRDAELLDPQQRMFLECAWHALEDAATPRKGSVGVYAGASLSSHLLRAAGRADPFQVGLANIGGMVAARTSFHLDLTGPAIGVQTTCSSSLVAIHQAMAGLRAGDCDMALAGAVAVNQARPAGYVHEPGSITAPDGTCRPFDAAAAGTVFTNGAAVVVLKRLDDALADGDRIMGVLIGAAVNNDGAAKVGLNAPSVGGQAAVLSAALRHAGIGAADVDYVEAHGTGTALGDPIELTALNRAYGPGLTAAGRRCLLGAVKGNVGHMDAAAGMAGLVKVLLAFQHDHLPGTAHFTMPGPNLSPGVFDILAEGRDWPRDPARPRRAGLSSFGIGGTNAHLIVQEPPVAAPVMAARGPQLLPISARTDGALAVMRDNLASALAGNVSLADVAQTLQTGRQAMARRQVVVADTCEQAIAALRAPGQVLHPMAGQPAPVFVFSGQGSQRAGMARDLYADPAFRAALDDCLALVPDSLDLRTVLLDPATDPDRIHQTRVTQPGLFVFEYALARMWMARGVQPVAMLGHSVGEYVAACLAGVFGLPDAIRAVVARGEAMQACPPGAMLAVMMSEAEASGALPHGTEIAAVNGPRSVTLAGPVEAIDALAAQLDRSGIGARRLVTSHAFHSAMMDPALDAFAGVLNGLTLRAPQIAMLSNVTGDWLDDRAADPAYWLSHLRQPVRFGEAIRHLMGLDHPLLIEVGPGAGLIRLARQGMADHARGVASLPDAGAVDGAAEILRATGEIWAAGVAVDWAALHDGPRKRLSLPGYPFERQSFWLPMPVPGAAAADDGWFHQPIWRRLPLQSPEPAKALLVLGAGLLNGWPADAISVTPETLADHLCDGAEIVCAWGLAPDPLPRILTLARALTAGTRLTLIGAGMHDVTGAEALSPESASVAALAPVLEQEVPGLRCRVIDLDPADPARGLAKALAVPWQDGTLALRGGHLWHADHAGVALPVPAPAPAGPCLIIGDLADGLAAAFARGIVSDWRQPLILAGDGLPQPPEWDRWLSGRPDADPGARLIATLRDLDPAQIHVLGCDVTDAAALDAALTAAEARTGPVAGVFHSAAMGDAFYSPLTDALPAGIADRLDRRRATLRALRQVLGRRDAGFCLVQSSLSVLAGGRGLAAYAAENAWADAFAADANRSGVTRWQAVQWDAAETGSLAETLATARLLTLDEIWQAACRILAQPALTQVAVTPGNLRQRLAAPAPQPGPAPAQAVQTAYAAPRDPVETTVAAAMAEMLGVARVGIHDNFFERGGHSLMAIQIVNRLRREFGVDLPVRALLFEAPTAAGIAATIRTAQQAAAAQADLLDDLLTDIESERAPAE
ncbi:MAG: beta-ketoacyl synthase N-terminal-like domain-containing protein [Paracoccus sp. (in: a-proteobacteria)]|uniref:type I polyketide synthase n=1 Tax=Paracoccus sp. TaxID=267 RepID=UPI0026DFA764|nr:type I polyketide synthase [Paracoccus sp. (in: a-proteobacteria)]MDO5611888.1 beta-ketoacyl synthase N-terminal-like domain-containing protein [Paracoccus sp. (in: a-proteobacteria)]